VTTLYGKYTLEPSERTPSEIDTLPKYYVADMSRIPQDPFYYVTQTIAMDKTEQRRYDDKYNRHYFRPWRVTRSSIKKADLTWQVRFFDTPSYTAKGAIIAPKTYNQWIKNASLEALGTQNLYAITIRHTNLRIFPTRMAYYRDPSKSGEGFPFDYNQNSACYLNTPVIVSHYSLDKKWAYVETGFASGWLERDDIALVDRKFKKAFGTGSYGVTIQDNLRLYKNAKSLSIVKLNTLFPYSRQGYIFATKGADGYAKIAYFHTTHHGIIASKPLRFIPQNIAKIAKEFYDEPYGWGGGYECRDCSATTRDFLGVFGIFVGRNSAQQARDAEQLVLNAKNKAEKKATIIAKAIPFRSLLYTKGHVMLYLGHFGNEPVIMHTYWGVRKNDMTKLITARTIISTTEPAKERSDVREESKLIHTIESITNF